MGWWACGGIRSPMLISMNCFFDSLTKDLAVGKSIGAVDSCSYCVDLDLDLDEMRGPGTCLLSYPDLCITNARSREGSLDCIEPLARLWVFINLGLLRTSTFFSFFNILIQHLSHRSAPLPARLSSVATAYSFLYLHKHHFSTSSSSCIPKSLSPRPSRACSGP